MKYFKTFEQFINEQNLALSESKKFIEVSVRDARKASDHLNDEHRGQYETDGSNYYIFKDEDDAYDALQHLRNMKIEIYDTDVNESINSRVRSKIVVALKKHGFENTIDYTYSGGFFMALDIETAQNMADALGDDYKISIKDDIATKDGSIQMMIVEAV